MNMNSKGGEKLPLLHELTIILRGVGITSEGTILPLWLACAERHLGLRRLDAAFDIVLGAISRRRRAAAAQGASHITGDRLSRLVAPCYDARTVAEEFT